MLKIFLNINLWAVLGASVAAFVLGGIWYSPWLFGQAWIIEVGKAGVSYTPSHSICVFLGAFALSFIAALALALVLGPKPTFNYACWLGFMIGAAWVASSLGINYLFADKSFKLFLIDAGYHIFQFTLYGVILGWWHK